MLGSWQKMIEFYRRLNRDINFFFCQRINFSVIAERQMRVKLRVWTSVAWVQTSSRTFFLFSISLSACISISLYIIFKRFTVKIRRHLYRAIFFCFLVYLLRFTNSDCRVKSDSKSKSIKIAVISYKLFDFSKAKSYKISTSFASDF